MPKVVGVRFKPCGKIYNFEVNGVAAKLGMRVVVESEMGLSLGVVASAKHDIEQPEQPLKKVLRIATVQDIETDKNNRLLEEEAKTFCIEKVKNRNLPMRVVGTEATLDKKRLIFYFTAEGRIDFRELVRDLASKFRTRIEMRQIGVRDEVKLLGGIGICGKEVCCKTFLTSFEPVSIRMAKKQELVLNPGKLSGICGRLMCCLGYEIDQLAKEVEDLTLREEVISLENEVESVEHVVVSEESILDEDLSESTRTETLPILLPPPPDKSEVRSEPVVDSTLREESKFRDEQRKTFSDKPDRGKPFSKRKKFWRKKKK
jgi:cell fate regulator YaaT (PSP1 superfamily)